ncbi:MAG: Rrf2 family transcriptional regulator [Sandaracinaceae bacterium]
MRLTQKTDFALRALMTLAAQEKRGATSDEIATSHGLSTSHTRKVLQSLRRAGFVISKQGRGGRSWLARPAAEIDLADVVRALEPDELVECFGTDSRCMIDEACGVQAHLRRAAEAFYSALAGVDLAALVKPEALVVLRTGRV